MMRVLITGGSGFLGRGIMRYAESHWDDTRFVVYSRDEYKQDLCREKFPDADYMLGDIKDHDRLLRALEGVDACIHTAAIKYIPEAEYNVAECIAVNVDGTRSVLAACYEQSVSSVIGISTDKATLPINVYGMTKALMERLFGEYSVHMHCALTRYGNVIGSTGSVIPKFQKQLARDGCLTLTDPDMTRYWISIDEACNLIELAMTARSGSVIIPKPRAMTMGELATTIIADFKKRECGMLKGQGIEIIGMRVGEKRHEALLGLDESVRAKDQSTHYELLKVGTPVVNDRPFILSSNAPQGGWITAAELIANMETASQV